MKAEAAINQKDIETLQKSPLFHFSLTEKELFHSNFLAWLLKKYCSKDLENIKSLFPESLFQNDRKWKILEVQREKDKNKDISITLKCGHLETKVYIENKIKSMPSKIQLMKYSADIIKENIEKNKNSSFIEDIRHGILLSITEPDFDLCFSPEEMNHFMNQYEDSKGRKIYAHLSTQNKFTWKRIDYKELRNILNNILKSSIISSNYERGIVEDYIGIILSLENLYNSFCFPKRKTSGPFVLSDKNKKTLTECRIMDLVDKYNYQYLSNIVIEKLKNEELRTIAIKPINTCFETNNMQSFIWENSNNDWDIQIGSSYSNKGKTGILDVKYRIPINTDNSFMYGIQLNGGQFRQFFEYKETSKNRQCLDKLLSVAKSIRGKKLWLAFEEKGKLCPEELIQIPEEPTINGRLNLPPFGNYNGSFFYRYKKIDQFSLDEIVQFILDYHSTAYENRKSIKNVIESL